MVERIGTARITNQSQSRLRLRADASVSAGVLRFLLPGESMLVEMTGKSKRADGYQWVQFRDNRGVYWCAEMFVSVDFVQSSLRKPMPEPVRVVLSPRSVWQSLPPKDVQVMHFYHGKWAGKTFEARAIEAALAIEGDPIAWKRHAGGFQVGDVQLEQYAAIGLEQSDGVAVYLYMFSGSDNKFYVCTAQTLYWYIDPEQPLTSPNPHGASRGGREPMHRVDMDAMKRFDIQWSRVLQRDTTLAPVDAWLRDIDD